MSRCRRLVVKGLLVNSHHVCLFQLICVVHFTSHPFSMPISLNYIVKRSPGKNTQETRERGETSFGESRPGRSPSIWSSYGYEAEKGDCLSPSFET